MGTPVSTTVDSLGLSSWEAQLIDCNAAAHDTVRGAGRQAIRHLIDAWELQSTKAELAIFAAITAEEEAATAVIRSLQLRQYPGASKLNPRNHIHKAGIYPFVRAIQFELDDFLLKAQLRVNVVTNDSTGEKHLVVEVPSEDGKASKYLLPLDQKLPPDDGVTVMAAARIRTGESFGAGVSAHEAIKSQANARNIALYSTPQGMRSFSGDIAKEMARARQAVFVLLAIALAIEGHPQKQRVVLAALKEYLDIVAPVRASAGGPSSHSIADNDSASTP